MKTLASILLSVSIASAQYLGGVTGVRVSALRHSGVLPANGLVAAWDFGEGSGTTIHDLVPGGTHAATFGTGTHAPVWLWGGAIGCSGIYGTFAQMAALNGGSLSAVIAYGSPGSQTVGTGNYPFALSAVESSGAYSGWALITKGSQSPNNQQLYLFASAAGEQYTGSAIPAYSVWGVSANAGTWSYYLNGVQVYTGTGNPTITNYSGAAGFCDEDPSSGITNPYTGAISFAAVWNRALSAQEQASVATYVTPRAQARSSIHTDYSPVIATMPGGFVSVPSNGLGLVPKMGYNSFYGLGGSPTWAAYQTQISHLISTGLAAEGYKYLMAPTVAVLDYTPSGDIYLPSFPDGLATFCSYAHAQTPALKCEWSSSPGQIEGCVGGRGTYGWDLPLAKAWATDGIDSYFMDWCDAEVDYADQVTVDGNDPVIHMIAQYVGLGLEGSGRPMLYEVNLGSGTGNLGYSESTGYSWFASVGANIMRTTGDGGASFTNWSTSLGGHPSVFDASVGYSALTQPGLFPDMDDLVPGYTTWTDAQVQFAMSFEAINSSTLTIGADLTAITANSLATLGGPEAIAIDQDPLGKPGYQVSKTACGGDYCYVYAKQLTGTNTCAVGLFNNDTAAHSITATFATIASVVSACGSGPYNSSTNVWGLWPSCGLSAGSTPVACGTSLGTLTTSYTTSVPAQSAFLMKVAPGSALVPAHVQSCANSNLTTGITSLACTFSSSVGAGHFVHLCVNAYGTPLSSLSFTGDTGTFTPYITNSNAGSLYVSCVYVPSASGGETTITASFGSAGYPGISGDEYSNVGALDVTGTLNAATSSTAATNSITPTANGDLVIASVYSSFTETATSPFVSGQPGTFYIPNIQSYYVQPTAGSINTSFSLASSSFWLTNIAAFKHP